MGKHATRMEIGPLEKAVRKDRKFKTPRSVNGCITCKTRRVKCDEGKPGCLRCAKFGFPCEGYKPEKKGSKDLQEKRAVVARAHSSPITCSQPSQGLHFQNETEGSYFLFFRDQVVPELATGIALSSSLWNQVMLQTCHSESFIRTIAVALAALKMSLSSPHRSEAYFRHYKFACVEYDKALRSMRKAVTNREEDLRRILIGCLFVFCFEVFQGNEAKAIKQARSGCRLLQNWQGQNLGLGRSRAPLVVEDELVHAFSRLDLQTMTFTVARSDEVHDVRMRDGESMVEEMPALFADYKEGYQYWEMIMRRSCHFVYWTNDEFKAKNGKGKEVKGKLLEQGSTRSQATEGSQENFKEADSNSSANPKPVPSYIQTEALLRSSEISRWISAFRKIHQSPSPSIRSAAALLEVNIQALQLMIHAQSKTCSSHSPIPQSFNSIFHFCDIFLKLENVPRYPSLRKKETLMVYIGSLPSLDLVVNMCKKVELGREAQEFLGKMRREGVWDREVGWCWRKETSETEKGTPEM